MPRVNLILFAVILFCGPILQAATIRTIAGNGTKGFSGDGGPAIQAQLSDPAGIARGPDGALYICDTANHRIRKVTADGKISTIAGTGEPGRGGDGGPATLAKLAEPYEVRLDKPGNVFWVERLNHRVRRMDRETGIVITMAGIGTAGFSGDGESTTLAQMNEPHSFGFDREGDLYICDVRNNRIRKVTIRTGIISTFCGTGERKAITDGTPIAGAPLSGPRALDFDRNGDLWVALREGNAILRLDMRQGKVYRVAGTGKKGFTGDGGPAREATLSGPKGISAAPNGNIYIADTENHVIRMIDVKRGTIELVAGTGKAGDGPDGDPLHCQLSRPHGIFVDADGKIYIGDTEAQRIRVIEAGK